MNPISLKTLDQAQAFIADVHALIAHPAFDLFDIPEGGLSGGLIQFFPAASLPQRKRPEAAKALARVMGGKWEARGDGSWNGSALTFPGFAGKECVLHYVNGRTHEPVWIDLTPATVAAEADAGACPPVEFTGSLAAQLAQEISQ